jgi:hypothetical protein
MSLETPVWCATVRAVRSSSVGEIEIGKLDVQGFQIEQCAAIPHGRTEFDHLGTGEVPHSLGVMDVPANVGKGPDAGDARFIGTKGEIPRYLLPIHWSKCHPRCRRQVGQKNGTFYRKSCSLAVCQLHVIRRVAIAAKPDEPASEQFPLPSVDGDTRRPKLLDCLEPVIVTVDQQKGEVMPRDEADEVGGIGLVPGNGDITGGEYKIDFTAAQSEASVQAGQRTVIAV